MKQIYLLAVSMACVSLWAQAPTAPVVSPRGVINAFTQQPAPTSVGAGGLIWINGLNLGPADGLTAKDAPWPTTLGTPPIQVLINNRPSPIYSITPSRIVAQVPYEIQAGLAQLVVRRGNVSSQPVRFTVLATLPSVKTAGDIGYGSGDFSANGSSVVLRAMGIGLTDPRVATGAVGTKDTPAIPRNAARAVVGGKVANATAVASSERVGEFDVTVDLPGDAKPGDVITLQFGNATANRTLYQRIPQAAVTYLKFPEGTPDFRGFTPSDLRPGYIGFAAVPGDDGCYPSYVADVLNAKLSKLDGCLITAARQLVSPFTAANEGNALAALLGPAVGQAPAGISKKMAIFNPAKSDAMSVNLPTAVATLGSAGAGNFLAVAAGQGSTTQIVDSDTGELRAVAAGGGGGGGGAGGGGGGAGAALPAINLGDGLNNVVSTGIAFGQGVTAFLVVDDVAKPTKAKIAILNAQGVVQSTRDFPASYLPIITPLQPVNPGAAAAARNRTSFLADATSRIVYVLSAKNDSSMHAFIGFPIVDGEAKVHALPEKTFFSACSTQLRIFTLELSRKISVSVGSNAAATLRNPCTAQGFASFDLATFEVSIVNIPGAGAFNASGTSEIELYDYVFGANADPSRNNRADTLYVFDGVTSSSFRFDLPPDVQTFSNLIPIPEMNSVLGLATNRVAGDAGLIFFDFDLAASKLLPTPSGFAVVAPIAVYPATRKLLARGTKTNPAATEFLLYDLVSGDLTIIPNPEGVSFVGQLPAVAGAGGGGGGQVQVLQRANVKANVMEAVTYSAVRKQTGVILIQVN